MFGNSDVPCSSMFTSVATAVFHPSVYVGDPRSDSFTAVAPVFGAPITPIPVTGADVPMGIAIPAAPF